MPSVGGSHKKPFVSSTLRCCREASVFADKSAEDQAEEQAVGGRSVRLASREEGSGYECKFQISDYFRAFEQDEKRYVHRCAKQACFK